MERFGHMFDISSRRKEMLKKFNGGGHEHLTLEDFEAAFNKEKKWRRKVGKRKARSTSASAC